MLQLLNNTVELPQLCFLGVKATECTSNNTIEVEKTLGIEAAR